MIYKGSVENEQKVIDMLDEGIYKGFHYVIVSYGIHPCAYIEFQRGISCIMLVTKMNFIILLVMVELILTHIQDFHLSLLKILIRVIILVGVSLLLVMTIFLVFVTVARNGQPKKYLKMLRML